MTESPIDLSRAVIGLQRDGKARIVPQVPGRPPKRIDGYTVGAPLVTGPSPHNGEMHPDGDELLYVISGSFSLHVEEGGSERVVELTAGQAFVVPRGVWHRLVQKEPSQLLHITPGPGGEYRPLEKRA